LWNECRIEEIEITENGLMMLGQDPTYGLEETKIRNYVAGYKLRVLKGDTIFE